MCVCQWGGAPLSSVYTKKVIRLSSVTLGFTLTMHTEVGSLLQDTQGGLK